MNTIAEAVVLSADALIFAYFLKSYLKSKSSVQHLHDAPHFNVDGKLADSVVDNSGKLPYAILRGNVEALSPPIHSFYTPTATGVVQKVTVREHVVSQTRSGFWIDDKRLINSVVNSVPFAIKSVDKNVGVEVVDALRANVLDLEVVADRFDPSPNTFFQNLWQMATGMRKQGVQTMEELLKEGTLVTVVGEVEGKHGSLTVGPPSGDIPFFITTMPLPALVRRIEGDITFYKWMTIGFGVVTAMTCAWMIYKRLRERFKKQTEQRIQENRRERRKKARAADDLNEDQLCVVCQTNPKELILLPCGHVCLCEDCSDHIPDKCPICKQQIVSRNVAYIV